LDLLKVPAGVGLLPAQPALVCEEFAASIWSDATIEV
jgi:hypothetical protein